MMTKKRLEELERKATSGCDTAPAVALELIGEVRLLATMLGKALEAVSREDDLELERQIDAVLNPLIDDADPYADEAASHG
jgi:hypothetical protein